MIESERVLGVIAARGGSKGLPRKNILPLAGRPLIAWSIEAAAQSKYLDRTIVSTDSDEIAEIARRYGGDVPFIRPAALATDAASVTDAVLDAVDRLSERFAYVVLLQATSPLRTAVDIDGSIALLRSHQASSCVTMTKVSKGPWWMYTLDERARTRPVLRMEEKIERRQDLPAVYVPNGAVYVAPIEWLRRTRSFFADDTVAYVMPPERSCDIDTSLDFELAQALVAGRDVSSI